MTIDNLGRVVASSWCDKVETLKWLAGEVGRKSWPITSGRERGEGERARKKWNKKRKEKRKNTS